MPTTEASSSPPGPDAAGPAFAPAAPAAARQRRDAELAALLARVAAGQVDAFEAFYDATLGNAQALARRIVADADLEDTLSDAYFQVWQQAARFDAGRGSALAWLLNIVRSRALDRWRDGRRHAHAAIADDNGGEDNFGATAPPAAEAPGPDELAVVAERGSRLHAALQALSAQERWLLALAFFRELSHREISGATGLPLGTVKSVILRAQHRLRRALDGLGAAGTAGTADTA
jgi:RNA polymerase sigma-70 factor (ECF subfamily)